MTYHVTSFDLLTNHMMSHVTDPNTQLLTPAFPLWNTNTITRLGCLPNWDIGSTSYLGNTPIWKLQNLNDWKTQWPDRDTKACHKDRPVTPLIPFRLRACGCASGPHFGHSCFLLRIPFMHTWYMDIPQSSFSSLLLLLTAPEQLFQCLTTSHMFHTYTFAHDYSVSRSHFDVLYPLADHHGHNYWLCSQRCLFSNKTTNLSPHNWYIHLLTYSRNARYIIYLDYMVVNLDFHTVLHRYMAYGVQSAAVMHYLLSGWLISIGQLSPTNYAD